MTPILDVVSAYAQRTAALRLQHIARARRLADLDRAMEQPEVDGMRADLAAAHHGRHEAEVFRRQIGEARVTANAEGRDALDAADASLTEALEHWRVIEAGARRVLAGGALAG